MLLFCCHRKTHLSESKKGSGLRGVEAQGQGRGALFTGSNDHAVIKPNRRRGGVPRRNIRVRRPKLLTDILQMEASARLRLARLMAFFKPTASTSAADAFRRLLALRRETITGEFSVIKAHPSRGF